MSLGARQKREQSAAYDKDHVVKDILNFSHEMYKRAYDFFTRKDVEEAMLDIMLQHLSFDLKEKLRGKVFLLVPSRDMGGAYGYIVGKLYGKMTFSEDMLEESSELKRYNLQSLALYLLASGEKIPLEAEATERDAKSAGAGVSALSLKIGGRAEKESNFQVSSKIILKRKHVRFIIKRAIREFDRRGGLLLIILSSDDTKLFGRILTDISPRPENIKFVITLPPRSGADAFYDILSREEVFSLFFTTASHDEMVKIVEAVYMAVVGDKVKKMMPEDLRGLVEFLDKRGYLKKSVEIIANEVGCNPVLTLRAVGELLARMYGHVNGRVEELEAKLENLRRQGFEQILRRVEEGISSLVSESIRVAVRSVIGNVTRNGVILSTNGVEYISQLREFIVGLSIERVRCLSHALEEHVASCMDAVYVLLNIGAVKVSDGMLKMTYIGRILRVLLKSRLMAYKLGKKQSSDLSHRPKRRRSRSRLCPPWAGCGCRQFRCGTPSGRSSSRLSRRP